MNYQESQMQQAIIRWAAYSRHKDILKHLHHSPNGGARSKTEGARFKREGVRPGFPDLVLLVPRNYYNGLIIELKTPKGRLTIDQKEWLHFLETQGYCTHVCRSVDSAIKVIEEYLK